MLCRDRASCAARTRLQWPSSSQKAVYIEKNIQSRFKFAQDHVIKPITFWEDVIFAGKSKFNIFGSDDMSYMWRKANTQLKNKNLKPTVRHGG